MAAKPKRFDRPKIEFVAENGDGAGVRLRKGGKGIGAKLVSRTKAQFRQIPALPISTPKFDGDSRHYSASRPSARRSNRTC